MKTGELFLNIKSKDIKALFINKLGLEYNKLCPFSEYLNDESKENADLVHINSVATNPNAVFLIKGLAKPLSLLQIRLGGPKEKYTKLSVCRIDENRFILAIYDGDSYGIQYYEDKNLLAEILESLIINSDAEGGSSFPDDLNFESLVLFLALIDSHKYIKYRDTLNHRISSIYKITSEEFKKVMQGSIEKFDVNWILSNLIYYLPSAAKFELKGNQEIYDEFFKKGYLISVTDNMTNESSLLLDIKSSALGEEFLELWYKSAGVQLLYLNDSDVESHPSAFIAVTGIANHTFLFEENSDKIIYKNYNSAVTSKLFLQFLEKLNYGEIISEDDKKQKSGFCGKCGAKLAAGAKFCGKCGNNI